MSEVLTALGLVAVIEGLVLALAPLRFEEALEWLRSLDPQTRRLLGLTAMSVGVLVIWAGRQLG